MADLQVLKALLPDNPLCGINIYKDTLNLATGACVRQIKKYVFTGEENGTVYSTGTSRKGIEITGITGIIGGNADIAILAICTHYQPYTRNTLYRNTDNGISNAYQNDKIIFYDASCQTVEAFQQFCAQQYAAGTPVTVWYVLEEPTTETITVPSGLSGTEEGYLTQSETPTPTNPVYPTANEVLIWQHSLRKLTTATDTVTTLPAVLYPNAATATVGLKGNMEQTGTPTPDSPIMPQGTGEMSSNLFDISTWNNATATRGTISISGNAITLTATSADCYTNTYSLSKYNIPVISGETYTLSWDTDYESGIIYVFTGTTLAATVLALVQSSKKSITVTVPNNHTVLSFRLGASSKGDIGVYSNIMLNTGSIPLPYEPYGQYKIPILCGNQTTNIYLGETQSTRRIQKVVFKGNEEIYQYDYSDTKGISIINILDTSCYRALGLCTHYQVKQATTTHCVWLGVNNRTCYFVSILDDLGLTTVNQFKSWLTTQYNAGTPVTVYYVMATPETTTINEPLMKIGDYADEVSGITIPTTAGANSFDVLTTLKPSEVTANYHGWHTGAVHERDSGQWN